MNLIKNSIGTYADEIFNKYKYKEAIIYVNDSRRITYDKLQEAINRFSKVLISMGIKKGDFVAICAPNSPESIITMISVFKIGAVAACFNSSSTKKELRYLLSQADFKAFIVDDDIYAEDISADYSGNLIRISDIVKMKFENVNYDCISDEMLKDISDKVSYKDTAAILYTSGTTGRPKGVVFTNYAVLNSIRSHIENFKYSARDRIFNALPICHIMGGFCTSFVALFIGATLILMKSFKTLPALHALETEKCTGIHAVPTMFKFLLNKCDCYDFSSMRVGMIAGASSSPILMKAVMSSLHITELHNAFGQTEALGITENPLTSSSMSKINTVGRAVQHAAIKIWDNVNNRDLPAGISGEIIVKSPFMMTEYFNNVEETKKNLKDGWFHTGDIGKLDDDGYLIVKGRLKDIVIRGGENIAPLEIENILLEYRKVETVCVFGVPDKVMGEELCAMIKVKENEFIDQDDFNKYLSENLPKYKIPKYIKFINNFPLTSTGKIQKNALKEIAVDLIK